MFVATSHVVDATRARRLDRFNRWRWLPRIDEENGSDLASEYLLRLDEQAFVEAEREGIRGRLTSVPDDPDEFVRWFESLETTGPGQRDLLFPWLAEYASRDQMTWFLRQEIGGEAGFDDLVATTQVKMPARVKLELARNYWDEMGRGNAGGMHGPMLARLAEELDIRGAGEDVVWESLALGNLMSALATHRHYAFQSLGALGAIELTAPWRASHVNQGLKRLGIGGEARTYFALHATLDVKHSEAWNAEVLRPLVAAEPRTAALLAEGALLRLRAGERCYERYRQHLWGAS